MRHALELARRAAAQGEVPIGAVLVNTAARSDEVLGEGFNRPIGAQDPTAHAEVQALREAGARLGNYRLPGTTLYVTLEPCMMCAGALVHARVQRLVYGAREPKAGAVDSHALLDQAWLNHDVDVTSGVLAQECADLLRAFFAARRAGGD
jgi:tRNA(adenine34) deaminase